MVDPLRVIDIVGLDRQADGGTHVASTGEVRYVRVVKAEFSVTVLGLVASDRAGRSWSGGGLTPRPVVVRRD